MMYLCSVLVTATVTLLLTRKKINYIPWEFQEDTAVGIVSTVIFWHLGFPKRLIVSCPFILHLTRINQCIPNKITLFGFLLPYVIRFYPFLSTFLPKDKLHLSNNDEETVVQVVPLEQVFGKTVQIIAEQLLMYWLFLLTSLYRQVPSK